MAAPSLSLGDPLIQQVVSNRACRVWKVIGLLSAASFGCTVLWAFGNDDQEFAEMAPTASMNVMMPMKLSNFRLPRRPEVQVHAGGPGPRKRWDPAERGTSARPRMSVHKSNNHLYAYIVDDEMDNNVLAQVNTAGKNLNGEPNPLYKMRKSKETGRAVGEKLAEIALAKGINEVVFDRGRYKYHGIVKEVADAARSKGLLDNVNPNRVSVPAS